MVSLVLFISFARVLCNRYHARWISKTKSQNTRKWRNGGIINPLFDGITYNTSGHPRILYVKPSNNVCIFTSRLVNNASLLAASWKQVYSRMHGRSCEATEPSTWMYPNVLMPKMS